MKVYRPYLPLFMALSPASFERAANFHTIMIGARDIQGKMSNVLTSLLSLVGELPGSQDDGRKGFSEPSITPPLVTLGRAREAEGGVLSHQGSKSTPPPQVVTGGSKRGNAHRKAAASRDRERPQNATKDSVPIRGQDSY